MYYQTISTILNYYLIIIFIIMYLMAISELTAVSQSSSSIFDRFRQLKNDNNNKNVSKIQNQNEEAIKVVSGTKVKRFDRLSIPLNGNLIQYPHSAYGFKVLTPFWQAGAHMMGEGESTIAGLVTFQQLPYNNDIRVSINLTGLPTGKHAVHIHTFGDISQGCKSTGGQFPNNFIGNIDAKEDGSVSTAFISVFLRLFGFNGIVGRSIVIHEKALDLNIALNADIFSTAIQANPEAYAYQNEENAVGPAIACGVISILSTEMMMMPTSAPAPEAEPAPELRRK